MHAQFPLPDLARALLPHAFDSRDSRDSAHDEAHLLRVWRNAQKIMAQEGGDTRILLAATLLHDCVHVDKGAPERSLASRMAAARASDLLGEMGWSAADTAQVAHAIEAHSFSAQIPPQSLEAKILQDADRLDALGYMGVARCLALSGARGAAICHATDPGALNRPLDEDAFALDHFQTKLLGFGKGMQTETGRTMAAARSADLRRFYDGLLAEIG
ncbi:HD domain-containing protein [Pseudooceanicola sp. CBS1P-1]|uniref:HD domain-containing protein n=1 Tax=Pseudooceanicola albus TaxID=2692189 RepID=A0A6L7G9R8_9RHOB|nr:MULTISPECIES: HD domain-containing protein [Pseudooceanicola]MBT9386420.1 HD domain-containing protein [Pseudooceanicola endophyticus]MXN20422.1 HD domain-containing protein [Pseudooceanicola albus]